MNNNPQIIKNYVRNIVKKNNKSGSVLFHGLSNAPKLSVAHRAILMLNCYDLVELDPCGECNACERLKTFNHPDLHVVLPLPNEKKIELEAIRLWKQNVVKNNNLSFTDWKKIIASNLGTEKELIIRSEAITKINSVLKLRNFEAKKRVILIWHAEKLNSVASNKLLKMLEEPPDETYFFLVANNKDELLETIKSRLERIYIPEKLCSTTLTLATKAKNMENSTNVFMLDDINDESLNKFKKWMRACHSKNIVDLFDLNLEISKNTKNGHKNFMGFCSEMLSFCVRYIIYKKETVERVIDGGFVNKFCKHLSLETLFKLLKKTERAVYLLERNANAKILFLSLSIEFFKIFDENKL